MCMQVYRQNPHLLLVRKGMCTFRIAKYVGVHNVKIEEFEGKATNIAYSMQKRKSKALYKLLVCNGKIRQETATHKMQNLNV